MKKLFNKNYTQINFLDERFYESGKRKDIFYPGATTILNMWNKPGLDKWKKEVGMQVDIILEKAATQGSNVHELVETFNKGAEVNLLDKDKKEQYTSLEWIMFCRYLEFFKRYKPGILAVEQKLASDKYMFGGQVDLLCKINAETWLIDHKTGQHYEDNFFQIVSYAQLVAEHGIKIDRMGVLYLNARTKTEREYQGVGWQLKELPADKINWAWSRFRNCQDQWMMHNAKNKDGQEWTPQDGYTKEVILPVPKSLTLPTKAKIDDYKK